MLSADETPALAIKPVDVADLTRAALAKHHVLADAAGLTLDVDLPVALPSRLDPTAYEQVVDNLVSNAVKYTHVGSVSVSVVPGPAGPGGFTLTVADTGIGMGEPEVRAAFDRYFRGRSALAEAIQGVGLGLAITRRLVELHGGTIALRSAPGVGTTAVVRFPASD